MRGRQDHPTREGLDQVSADRAELYICRLPEVIQVFLLVQPLAVNDDIPTETEIEMAVLGLKRGRAGVPPGMLLEYLQGWLKEAKTEKDPERRMW